MKYITYILALFIFEQTLIKCDLFSTYNTYSVIDCFS
uniref:Uncharacterized protein n=1 Tax=Anguilla anguilla TaxID=7936 RepID=A0A0E9XBI8_ANGAN